MTATARIIVEHAIVDNPHHSRDHAESQSNPRRITVVRNANESPIALLHSRQNIDEAQARAAFMLRAAYETLVGGYSAEIVEPVDGSPKRDPFPERRADAGKRLKEAEAKIARTRKGKTTWKVLHMVCAERNSIRQTARAIKARRPTTLRLLKGGLDVLVEHWKLGGGRS